VETKYAVRLADYSPHLAAHVADRNPTVHLPQHRRDLLDGKVLLLHGTTSWAEGPIVTRPSQFELRNWEAWRDAAGPDLNRRGGFAKLTGP